MKENIAKICIPIPENLPIGRYKFSANIFNKGATIQMDDQALVREVTTDAHALTVIDPNAEYRKGYDQAAKEVATVFALLFAAFIVFLAWLEIRRNKKITAKKKEKK